MVILRHLWSVLDAYVLRLFEGEDAAVLREIAHPLPPDARDVPAP